jgi:hypothetical protein
MTVKNVQFGKNPKYLTKKSSKYRAENLGVSFVFITQLGHPKNCVSDSPTACIFKYVNVCLFSARFNIVILVGKQMFHLMSDVQT